MVQSCVACRRVFEHDSHQRDYANFETYGFKSEEAFKKHSARNRKCPCKQLLDVCNEIQIEREEEHRIEREEELPTWMRMEDMIDDAICEDEYALLQEEAQIKIRNNDKRIEILNKKGKNVSKLWYPEPEECAANITENVILNPNISMVSVIAEPGSGKTAVTHNLVYQIIKLPQDKGMRPSNITMTTGMNDKDWYNQMMNSLKLQNGEYLWNELYNVDQNHCVTIRSTFYKRINYILNNQKLLKNHIFIIDESHFADEKGMSLDSNFKQLGLTEERMKHYGIKIILVSATPDVNLSIMERNQHHTVAILKNGTGYKGFHHFMKFGQIIDFNSNTDFVNLVRNNYHKPRYHFARVRISSKDSNYRDYLNNVCEQQDWILIEDDSDNDYIICHDNDETKQVPIGTKAINVYVRPPKHTIILLKNKYTASKRLKLTPYIGIVLEKPADKQNTTATSNGLVPRYFGYYNVEYGNENPSIFVCNLKCIEEYIKFSNNSGSGERFTYDGKDYTSLKLKSKVDGSRNEYKNTVYTHMASVERTTITPADTRREPKIEKFKTQDEVKKFYYEKLKPKYGGTGPKTHNRKNDQGFHLDTNVNVVLSTTELYNKRKDWANTDSRKFVYRVRPCYRDVNDNQTIEWWLIYYEP